MKAIYFTNLHYGETADLVWCPDCGANMLVPYGRSYCPLCGEELQWAHNENGEEVDEVILEGFLNNKNNEICMVSATYIDEED